MDDPYGGIADFYDMMYGADIDYEGEALGLFHLLGRRSAIHILDIGCGTASHLIRLAKFGCRGTGIDKSGGMIRVAREKAAAAGLPVKCMTGDVKTLEDVALEETFDAAISCYVLGLGCGPGEVEMALRQIHPLLIEQGLLVFNLMNAGCGFFRSQVPDFSCGACRDNGRKAAWFYQTVVDGDRQQMTAVYLMDNGDGVSMASHHTQIALFNLDQAKNILLRSGYELCSVYGAMTDLAQFKGDEPAIWLAAKKM